MADATATPRAHDKVGANRQKQANHFQAVLNDALAIANDPASTPEQVTEANDCKAAMEKLLQNLKDKYNVVPTV